MAIFLHNGNNGRLEMFLASEELAAFFAEDYLDLADKQGTAQVIYFYAELAPIDFDAALALGVPKDIS